VPTTFVGCVQGTTSAVGNALRGVPSFGRALLPSLALWGALAIGGIVSAADPAEPQPFHVDGTTQPLSAAPQAPAVSSNLRWRPASPVRVSDEEASAPRPLQPLEADAQPVSNSPATDAPPRGAGLRPATQPTTPIRTGWNVTRIDPNVRPAQATSPDPFKDPFGDRQADHREPTLLLRPTDAEIPVETLPPPRSATPITRTPAPPRAVFTASQPQPQLEPQMQSQKPQTLPAPGGNNPLLPPGKDDVPCDRVYNDRNCCDLEGKCSEFRERLLADSIRFISLDITPRYSPNLKPEEEKAELADKLRLLESRTWKNRTGQVLATGKMTGLQNSSVVISDDSGKEVGRVPLRELGEDEICYVTAWWSLPTECGLGGLRTASRDWIPSTFAWHASALCHKPLYFEQVQLERYGHTAGPLRQPFISGAHFFLSIAALPYKMAINPPHECQYALGYYRPGSCAPWMIPPVPLSLRGAVAETSFILGGVHLIP
jgi:hypothetical protein